MMPWRVLLTRTVAVGAIVGTFVAGAVFVGVKFAGADPGGPASPNALTYSGVLRNRAGIAPISGDVTLQFTFRREDGVSCPPVMSSTIASTDGAFSASVSTVGCPSGFFNGARVDYDVSLIVPSSEAGPLTPDGGVAITPVPYARFTDQAGTALVAVAASGALDARLTTLEARVSQIERNRVTRVSIFDTVTGLDSANRVNVSSVERLGAGLYRVHFTCPYADVRYAIALSGSDEGSTYTWTVINPSSVDIIVDEIYVDGGVQQHQRLSSYAGYITFLAMGTPSPTSCTP